MVGRNLGETNETIFQLNMTPVFLGLESLLFKKGNHQYSKALSTVRYIKFNKTLFRYLLYQNAKFHDAVRKQLGEEFSALETKYLRLHSNLKFHDRLKLFLEELHFKNLSLPIQTERISIHITHLEIAKYLGNKQGEIFSVIGGGDTVSVVNSMKIKNKFNFVSTAGGAFLEYLEGKILPGIKALN